ncbi:unnamed protein product [Vicia faba]|uniref:Uncharacterized protein n=1 Tax=Vicia faba TaxID=3906 RepID=A0AAV1BAF8_VICFA|nr:unnamed protein product [Vicia faba]
MKRELIEPKYGILSVIGFKGDEDSCKKIREYFKPDEHTLKLLTPNPSSQEELISLSEPCYASPDYDPANGNDGLTPLKRSLSDGLEDIEYPTFLQQANQRY